MAGREEIPGADDRRDAATIAVLDVGKTNIKLNAVAASGEVHETLAISNPTKDGPPWRHHDLEASSQWIFQSLAVLCRRHSVDTFVAAGHGSGGALVGSDPDKDSGTVLPMIDYEQPLPADIRDAYAPLSGSFFDRGSAMMLSSTHQARQMYWMQQAEPERFASARWFLGVPQYWAWRLSGVAASEVTFLSAQSHLWNVAENRWAPIVALQGWDRLMPPFARAWQTIGTIRPELAARHDLPRGMRVLAGIHDSSANFYRYQAAGLNEATVVSTGTWIVALSGQASLSRLDETRGMTCNSDVNGRPLGGALTMGGREFSHIAGPAAVVGNTLFETAMRLIGRQTMALPSFGDDDGLFPGSAGAGTIVGEQPQNPAEERALAMIYVALLTIECLEVLGSNGMTILDGSFLRDPLYTALVAAFRPGSETLYNPDAYGVAAGAALLASHETRHAPAGITVRTPDAFVCPQTELSAYAKRWRERSHDNAKSKPPQRHIRKGL
jgi:sugar (pentulose or hexulose) kinase